MSKGDLYNYRTGQGSSGGCGCGGVLCEGMVYIYEVAE